MPFSNPATLSAPIEGQDYFAWPCIFGERYAPTISGSAGYAGSGTRPCIQVTGGTAIVTWPVVPALGPDSSTFNGFTLTGFLRVLYSWASANLFPLQIFGANSGIRIRPNGTNTVEVWNGTGWTALTTLTGGQWVTFSITYAASGAVTYTVNGVSSATYPMAVPTTYIQLTMTGPADGGADAVAVSGLYLEYS